MANPGATARAHRRLTCCCRWQGFVFRRMYVQQALCAPSRTVLLTGRRPDTSHVWTIGPCTAPPALISHPCLLAGLRAR